MGGNSQFLRGWFSQSFSILIFEAIPFPYHHQHWNSKTYLILFIYLHWQNFQNIHPKISKIFTRENVTHVRIFTRATPLVSSKNIRYCMQQDPSITLNSYLHQWPHLHHHCGHDDASWSLGSLLCIWMVPVYFIQTEAVCLFSKEGGAAFQLDVSIKPTNVLLSWYWQTIVYYDQDVLCMFDCYDD